MIFPGMLIEHGKLIWATAPKDWTGAASTSLWINTKLYYRVDFVILTGAWAGGTAAVTLNQATDVAGTGSKALAMPFYWLGSGSQSSGDVLTKTAVTSNTFNLSAANKIAVIPIRASELDMANNFVCVQLAIATPGANADLYAAMAIAYGSRYPQTSPPSALID